MLGLAVLSLCAWIYLLAFRGGFWRARERDDRLPDYPGPARWPSVVAVVPARDEADVIERSIGSLLAQDYPGPLRIVLVDDDSGDGTGAAARALAGGSRLTVIAGRQLAPGWTGKLWAVAQGVEAAGAADDPPDYLLLTDADIEHAPDNLRRLVTHAEAKGLALDSLMVRLAVTTWAERLMIPAFVFFFAMLYPFAWANDPRRPLAAAAGGCMLARREALERAGGMAAIRGRIIDDCALAERMKGEGPIWLGLTNRAWSLRPYGGLAAIGAMIARSAYAQLGYSPWILAGALVAMAAIYLAPPMIFAFAGGPAAMVAGAAWLLMAAAFQPMLRVYRRSPLWGLALPLIAALYLAFTVRSALEVWRGRGGQWKGRAQAMAARP
ncbi:MAG: glycosyltransferase [Caulobacteraceae bacterium]|nr:glycosyltransferase [Caulobacteraceae bacterium]